MTRVDARLLLEQHRRQQAAVRRDLVTEAWTPPYVGESGASGAAVQPDAAVRLVRVSALHEADEEDNEKGPYLEVINQAAYYPAPAEEKFRFVYTGPDDDDDWVDIYNWVSNEDLEGVRAWFLDNGVTLGEILTVQLVGPGFKFLLTDEAEGKEYDIESAVPPPFTDWVVTQRAVEEMHYKDYGEPFEAFPDPHLADLKPRTQSLFDVDDTLYVFLVSGGWLFSAYERQALRLRVRQEFFDYLRCRTWDGMTEGADDIFVAKPPELRHDVRQFYVGDPDNPDPFTDQGPRSFDSWSVDLVRATKYLSPPTPPHTLEEWWFVTPPYIVNPRRSVLDRDPGETLQNRHFPPQRKRDQI